MAAPFQIGHSKNYFHLVNVKFYWFSFWDLYDGLPFKCGNINKRNYGLDFAKSIEALTQALTTKVVAKPIVVKSKWQKNKQKQKKKLYWKEHHNWGHKLIALTFWKLNITLVKPSWPASTKIPKSLETTIEEKPTSITSSSPTWKFYSINLESLK